MDLIVIIVLILLTIFFFRKFSNFVYVVCIIDIFLRVIHMICNLLKISIVTSFVNKYFSLSVVSIINKYTSGIVNTIFTWGYVFIYVCFLGYLIVYFFKKKKK